MGLKEKIVPHMVRLAHYSVMCAALVSTKAWAQDCVVFGPYSSSPAASYTCAFGLISFNYTGWVITNLGGGNISVTGSPPGSVQELSGSLNCGDSAFNASFFLPGSCTENYSLQGRFSSDTSWTGTFTATFTGGASCSDCVSQIFSISGTTVHTTGVSPPLIPFKMSLEQNFPNPFNPQTQINFSLSQASSVTLTIHNLLGQHIETLLDERLEAGSHSANWSPKGFPSGVYYYRLHTGQLSQTRHLVFLR